MAGSNSVGTGDPAIQGLRQSGTLKPMSQDLESLRSEIEQYFETSSLVVFYGYHRLLDALQQVSWDTQRHNDFRKFLAAAESAGVKLIVLNQQTFSLDQIDAALDQIEECDLTRDEKRQYENRIRQLQGYEGFTSSLELSFTLDGRTYSFEQQTEWYESFADIVSELDAASEEADEIEDDNSSLGGYFSNN